MIEHIDSLITQAEGHGAIRGHEPGHERLLAFDPTAFAYPSRAFELALTAAGFLVPDEIAAAARQEERDCGMREPTPEELAARERGRNSPLGKMKVRA